MLKRHANRRWQKLRAQESRNSQWRAKRAPHRPVSTTCLSLVSSRMLLSHYLTYFPFPLFVATKLKQIHQYLLLLGTAPSLLPSILLYLGVYGRVWVPICMHVETTSQPQVPSLRKEPPYFWDNASQVARLDWLAREPQGSALLRVPSTAFTSTYHHTFLAQTLVLKFSRPCTLLIEHLSIHSPNFR